MRPGNPLPGLALFPVLLIPLSLYPLIPFLVVFLPVLLEDGLVDIPYKRWQVLRDQRADDDEQHEESEKEIDDFQFRHRRITSRPNFPTS